MSAPKVGFASTEIVSAAEASKPLYSPVEAQLFYCEGAGSRSLVLGLDIMQLGRPFCDEMRELVARELRLEPDEVHTHCTHVHSSPYENELVESPGLGTIATRIAAAGREAMGSSTPALVELVEARPHQRLNYRRRQWIDEAAGALTMWTGVSVAGSRPDAGAMVRERMRGLLPAGRRDDEIASLSGPVYYEREVDDLVQMLVFRDTGPSRAPLGSVLRFSAHPVASRHSPGKPFGGDFPYFAREAVARELRSPCVFLSGPCGDIAPAEANAWRIQRRDSPGPGAFVPPGYATDEAAIAEARREGEAVAAAVLSSAELGANAAALERVECSVLVAELPIRETMLETADEGREAKGALWDEFVRLRDGGAAMSDVRAAANRYQHMSHVPAMHEEFYYATADEIRARRFAVQLPRIELNDILIAGLPGEACQWPTLHLREKLTRPVITLTEMNGDVGYMTEAGEFAGGDYEVCCSIIAPGALETMADAHLA